MYFSLDILDYIRRKYMPMRVESCGFIHSTQYGAIIQIMAEGNIKSPRPSCTLPYYTDYIWHTHINGSKSYPSAEDILKVLKKRKAIEHISVDLYNRTERGRAKNVNIEAIEKFMKSLISRYPNLRIFFTPWNKIINGYMCKTVSE